MTASTASSPAEKLSPNRREFLYAVGGASLALLGVGSCGLLAKFLNPPYILLLDNIYEVSLDQLPSDGDAPIGFWEGRYWLVNEDSNLLALVGKCTFRRDTNEEAAIPKWVEPNNRFECPVCGTKYQLDGTWIEGPSKRGLDRYVIQVTTPNGTLTTPPDGSPVSIEGTTKIVVDTNHIIYGQPRPER